MWEIRKADERDVGLMIDVLRHNALTRNREKIKRLAMVLVEHTVVACNPSDPDHALALCSSNDQYLHILYTKVPFRKMGIAASLLKHKGVTEPILTIPTRTSMIRARKENFYWIGEWI